MPAVNGTGNLPVPFFPGRIWDGSSFARDHTYIHKDADGFDYNQLVAEIIALQVAVQAGASIDLSGYANLTQPNLFLFGPQTIKAGNNANQTLILQRNSPSQVANILEIQDHDESLLAGVNKDGKFFGDGSLLTGVAGVPGGSNGQLQYNNGGVFDGTTGIIYANSGNLLTITSQAITDKPLSIKAISGQTANLQEWQNSSGAASLSVLSDGNLRTPTGNLRLTDNSNNIFLETNNGQSNCAIRQNIVDAATGGNSYNLQQSTGTFLVQSAGGIKWRQDASGGTIDVGIARNAAGVVKITNGGAGYGSLITISVLAPPVVSGIGSNLLIQAGTAFAGSNANGGDLILSAGPHDGSGTDGVIRIVNSSFQSQYASIWCPGGGSTLRIAASTSLVLDSNHCTFINSTGGGYYYIDNSTDVWGLGRDFHWAWANQQSANQPKDVGIKRSAAGILQLTDGASAYGSLIVGTSAIGTIPLTVRAIASQTANLQEWQDSAGAPGARITAALNFSRPGGINSEQFGFGANAAGNHSTAIGFNASAIYSTATVIGDSASATSASCVAIGYLASANVNSVAIGYNVASGNSSVLIGNSAVQLGNFATALGSGTSAGAGGVAIGYQAIAGGNTALANGSIAIGCQANGGTFFNSIVLGNLAVNTAANQMLVGSATAAITSLVIVGNATSTEYRPQLISSSAAIRDAALIKSTWADSADTTRKARLSFSVYDTAVREALRVEADGTAGLASFGGAAVIANSVLSSQAPAATYTPLTVRGFASQSANLQEWQNSSGVPLSFIQSTGRLILPDGTATNPSLANSTNNKGTGLYFVNDTINFSINTTAQIQFTTTPITIKSNGQLAWTNSTTNPATTLDTGIGRAAAGIVQITNGGAGTGTLLTGVGTKTVPGYSFVGDTTTGFWNNGTGNLVASCNNTNVWQVNTAAMRMSSGVQLNWASGDPALVGADVGFIRSAVGIVKVTNGGAGLGSLLVGTNAVGTVPLAVQAIASQTANLQEWQNSSGVAQSWVDSLGKFHGDGASLTNVVASSVVASADFTARTTGITVLSFTDTGAGGTYRISEYLDITAISGSTLSFILTWKDETNTTKTLTLIPMGGAALTSTGVYAFPDVTIKVFPSTTISIATSGTIVSVTYDVGGQFEKIR